MIYLAILSSLGAGAIATVLWHQVRSAAGVLPADPRAAPDGFLRAFRHILLELADEAFPADVAGPGIDRTPLRFREHQDSYETVGGLVRFVFERSGADGPAELESLVKAVYQLGHTLGGEPDRVSPALEILAARFRTSGRVARVATGELVDRRTMLPLNFGTHVDYPFGLVRFDDKNKIVGRAKVICR